MFVRLSTLLAICILPLAIAVDIPETLEALTPKSSECFGTHNKFQPTCAASSGTVIAVNALKVGAKPHDAECPDSVLNDTPYNDTCCMPDDTDDCIFPYLGNDNKQQLCSGRAECTMASGVSQDVTLKDCSDPSYVIYGLTTSYMFMEYACVETSRIYPITTSGTFTGNGQPVYLQTDGYPDIFNSGDFETSCAVTSTEPTVVVYTLDMRLSSEGGACRQEVKVKDSTGQTVTWDCDSDLRFTITSSEFTPPLEITFISHTLSERGYAWIGLDGGTLVFNCSTSYEVLNFTTPAPTTPPVITTPYDGDNDTSSQSGQNETDCSDDSETHVSPKEGENIGLIVGLLILAGVVIFQTLGAIAGVCLWHEKRKVDPDIEKRAQKSEVGRTNFMRNPNGTVVTREASAVAMETHRNDVFADTAPGTTTSNHAPPTQFIQEHDLARKTANEREQQPTLSLVNGSAGQGTSGATVALMTDGAISLTVQSDKKKKKKKKKHRHRHEEASDNNEGDAAMDVILGRSEYGPDGGDGEEDSERRERKKKKKKHRHRADDEDEHIEGGEETF